MRYFLWAFSLGVSFAISACQSNSSSVQPSLEPQRYELTGASRCDTSTRRGVEVSVAYFQLKENSEAAQAINSTLHDMAVGSISNWLDSTVVAKHPDARNDLNKAATLFAANYEDMMKEIGAVGGCWVLQTKGDTVYSNPKILSVKFDTYAYTGGAHPNSNTSFYNFDRSTGKPLSLTDLVTDTTALVSVVEKAFRKQQDLLPQYNLEERGYFLRDGKFFLPANIGVGHEGLLFYYNPYEIAAYALGPIEVKVPYTELNSILREEWRKAD